LNNDTSQGSDIVGGKSNESRKLEVNRTGIFSSLFKEKGLIAGSQYCWSNFTTTFVPDLKRITLIGWWWLRAVHLIGSNVSVAWGVSLAWPQMRLL